MTSLPPEELAEPIRRASQQLARELSFVNETTVDTGHSASAVQCLIEIGDGKETTVALLSSALNLEVSSIQSILRDLVVAGDIADFEPASDSEDQTLSLTAKGSELYATLTISARDQVLKSLSHIHPHDAQAVLHGLQTYASSLHAQRTGQTVKPSRDVHIVQGYRPGLIARTLQMHMDYYSRRAGFGAPYEQSFASNLSDMISHLDDERNGAWAAVVGGKIVGTIYIVGQDVEDNKARLRAFIVDDEVRGTGIGRRLLMEAVSFTEKHGFDETHLWTFQGQDVARGLYESFGFILKEELPGREWFKHVTVQLFVRKLGAEIKAARSTQASA